MSSSAPDAANEASDGDTAARVRRGLDYALLGGLVLLGVFAAIQFYLAADRTINVWVTREFRPPFKMVFNLVVLLVVGVGVSRQIRRLTGSDGDDEPRDTDPDATADGGVAAATEMEATGETTAPTRAGRADDADGSPPDRSTDGRS
ncbi:hypothetical protein [Salinigranum marinum]|uniref:hypothetical protein n=1 Tax=Salinigranum marinum TaxID=1515595 RepID=UPI002989FB43|nr:hypothetical protein [Salinigranum marinum]